MADFIEKVRSDGDILAEYEHWYAILDIKQYYPNLSSSKE